MEGVEMEVVGGVFSKRRCSHDLLVENRAKIAKTSSNFFLREYLQLTEKDADCNVVVPNSWNLAMVCLSSRYFGLCCPDSNDSLVSFHSFEMGNFPDGMGFFVFQSKLFLLGGSSIISGKRVFPLDIFVYDLRKKDVLTRCGELLGPKEDPKVVQVEGKLYILEGSCHVSAAAAVMFEVFDLTSKTSRQLPDPPFAARNHPLTWAYFVIGRTLYVGVRENNATIVCSFNLDHRMWYLHFDARTPNLNKCPNVVKPFIGRDPRLNLSQYVSQGKLYLLRTDCCTPQVCVYDLENPGDGSTDADEFDLEDYTDIPLDRSCCEYKLGKYCPPYKVAGKDLEAALSIVPCGDFCSYGEVLCVDEKSNKFFLVCCFEDRNSHKDSILVCDFELVEEDQISAKNVSSRTFTYYRKSVGIPFRFARF